MARYTFNYYEEDYGRIGFDAPNLEEAQRLFDSMCNGGLDYDELPNYSKSSRGGDLDFTDLSEVEAPLKPIPMLVKTGE
jgi:hypothetical protein